MERPESADNPDREDADVASDAAVRAAEAFEPGEEPSADPSPGRQAGRIARSTAFFSVATAASRIAGLVREIVAAGYYGVNGPMSAFTIAFQVPNLVRALFADAALQPAFVPIFTEQLEKGNTREAFRLASTLLLLVTLVLGSITAVFVLLAPVIMPLVAPGFSGEILDLTVTLSQILFPILILLGVSGVVVGILNSYDRFGAFAISPLFWNLTIIAALVFLIPKFEGQDRIYAYAIGILIGTLVQLMIPVWDLRNTPFRFKWSFEWRNPDVRRVLLLMLPVTISLGLINFNLIINSLFGSLVSDEAPAAIDKAFRIYQLPQGIFSVAIATVLFPTLARFAARGATDDLRATMANGMRQILFILVPAAASILVLSEPMIRLVYQRGEFTADPDDARRHRALLVRLLAADQRPLPAADADLLQPPAPLDTDRDRLRQPRDHRDRRPGALPPRRRRDRRRDRARHRGQRRRPDGDPARTSARPRAGPSSPTPAIRISVAVGGAGGGQLRSLGRARRGPRTRPPRPDRLARQRPGARRHRLRRRRQAA